MRRKRFSFRDLYLAIFMFSVVAALIFLHLEIATLQSHEKTFAKALMVLHGECSDDGDAHEVVFP